MTVFNEQDAGPQLVVGVIKSGGDILWHTSQLRTSNSTMLAARTHTEYLLGVVRRRQLQRHH